MVQLRNWLAALGIDVAASKKPERAYNSSISLTAAKALLALNEATRDESPERSRRLRAMLLEIAGPEFRVPDSVLRHMEHIFEKEAAYLADTLAIDKNWLLPETGGIDDALFFNWDYAEVTNLLTAIADALAKPEDKKEKPAAAKDGDQAVVAAGSD